MTAADEAYRVAERLVEEARESGAEVLSFARPDCRALDRLPEGIAGLTGLKGLSLDRTQVGDLSPLETMTELWGLSLNATQVSDLSPLETLTGLTILSLNDTQVSDLYPLGKLSLLTQLWLNGTQVSDLSPLEKLTGLTMLWLSYTQVSDLCPVEKLGELHFLWLSYTQVSDLSPLEKLSKLKLLALDGVPAIDLRPLRKLIRLATEPTMTGLTFKDTGAARVDPRIAEIAEISDNAQRARVLFDYLKAWDPPGAAPPPDEIGLRRLMVRLRNILGRRGGR
jgi:hypothetical protein